jgi:hypothetical protein
MSILGFTYSVLENSLKFSLGIKGYLGVAAASLYLRVLLIEFEVVCSSGLTAYEIALTH